MTKYLCVESRAVAVDQYAAGEVYSVDRARAEKYADYFVAADSEAATAWIAAQQAEFERRAAVEAEAREEAVQTASSLPSDAGMSEEEDDSGGLFVPEDTQATVVHDPGPGGRHAR